MFRILKFLFTGKWKMCEHQYTPVKEIELTKENGGVFGLVYISRCKQCGKYKEFRVVNHG